MGKMIDGSRMIFLNGKGEFTKIGHWYEENGLYFSNDSYKNFRFQKVKKTKIFDNEMKYMN